MVLRVLRYQTIRVEFERECVGGFEGLSMPVALMGPPGSLQVPLTIHWIGLQSGPVVWMAEHLQPF